MGYLGIACLVYLLYALLGSVVPHLFPVKMKPETAFCLSQASQMKGSSPGADRVRLVESTTDAFGCRIALLRAATKTLDIVCHSIHKGSCADAFLGELSNAADRGVKIRLVVDAKTGGASPYCRRALRALSAHPNIQCKVYNPICPFRPWRWQILCHDKFINSDNRYLLLGGRNLGDRYFAPAGFSGPVTEDRDVLVWRSRTSGHSVIWQVNRYMADLWQSAATRSVNAIPHEKTRRRLCREALCFQQENPRYYTLTLQDYLGQTLPANSILLLHNPIHTRKKEPVVAWQLRNLAFQSTNTIDIQTPYATADKHLLRALEQICESGVLCCYLTNSPASTPNLAAFSNYYLQRKKFLRTGARLFEYQSRHSIHGKSIILDRRLSAVGSFNLDERSFYLDTETMLLVDSPEFAASLLEAIDALRSGSLEVGAGNRYLPGEFPPVPVSCAKKAALYFASLLSRLLHVLV